MTDFELTRLAAKAFGNASETFSPLTDDGDALRLAITLKLSVNPYVYFDDRCQLPAIAKRRGPDSFSMIEEPVGRFPEYAESHVKHDPCAATRRAIVRAAAEIGKGMK